MIGLSRLENLKKDNALYSQMDDETILASRYQEHYKGKIGYEDYKSKMIEPITFEEQNKIALKKFVDRQNLTAEDVANYMNKKEIKEMQDQGEIGFIEGFSKNKTTDFIPFVSYVVDGLEASEMRGIIARAYNGDTLSDEENRKFRELNKELKEDNVRGYTVAGSISSNVGNLFRFPLEFLATGGVASGLGLTAKAGTTLGSKILASGIVKAGTYTILQSPTAVYSAYQSRQLANMLTITDKGEEFFEKVEKANNFSLKELVKGFGDVYVGNLTEIVGGSLIAPTMNKILPVFQKVSKKVFGETLNTVVAKMGWNGFIEEVFEEWLEKPLRQAMGLENNEYTLQNILESTKMSADELFLTLGMVAFQGGSSYATGALLNKLTSKGADPTKANLHLSTMTEKEKSSYLNQINKFETQQDITSYNAKLNNLKQELKSTGKYNEKEIEQQATLYDNMFIKYANEKGVARSKIFNKLQLEVKREEYKNTITDKNEFINFINKNISQEFKDSQNSGKDFNQEQLLSIVDNVNTAEKKNNKIKPKSILSWLNANGGLYDVGGDLKSMDIKKQYPFLLRKQQNKRQIDKKTGKEYIENSGIDRQFQRLVEEGYFPEVKDYREVNGVNMLIDAISEELRGNKQYKIEDTEAVRERDNMQEYIGQLEQVGIDFDDVRKLREWGENGSGKVGEGNGMESEVSSFYQSNPELKTKIDEVLEIAQNKNSDNTKIVIDNASKELIDILNKNGININGYQHTIDTTHIRHILNKHGENGEKLSKNSIAITNNDIKLIPFIIDNYDFIELGRKSANNNESIRYIKSLEDGNVYFVEEILEKTKRLNTTTMWKERSSQDKLLKLQTFASENSQGTATSSKNIIQNPNQKVKLNQSTSQQPKGQITLSNTKALITLFETADKSTFLHETGHYFLKLTEIMAKSGSRLAQSEIAEIRKFTGNRGGSFNVEQNELFARSFEAYLRRGIAPNSKLKEIFEKFKEWLVGIYESISELNVDLSPEVIDFFDSYITADVDVNAKANNEKLQRINDVNDKVKEIKNTLYQNKDITEAEVEDEIMKRLKSDVEMVEKLKSELPKDIQEDIVKNDYLKMDRVQFLENKIENIKSKGTKEYKKELIDIMNKSGLEEQQKKAIMPILNTLENSEDFLNVKERLNRIIRLNSRYEVERAIQYSKDLPQESFELFKDLREYANLKTDEAFVKYKEFINSMPISELDSQDNILRSKFLIYKTQGIFAEPDIKQEVLNLIKSFKTKKELQKKYKGVLPSEINNIKKKINNLITESGLRSEYIAFHKMIECNNSLLQRAIGK